MVRRAGNSVLVMMVWLTAAVSAAAQNPVPCDAQATRETINLYKHLFQLREKGFLFGHQDDLAYGVHWQYQKDSSDVKGVTGDYPGLYGWDLSGLESDRANDIDGVPFKKMREYIRAGYQRGGVITLSWHAPSPLGAVKGAWDTTHGTVASILPGGANHLMYKEWLDKLAAFIGSLKGNRGEAIPVLFRPFHEFTGNWFWWCQNACSAFKFKTLWRFTIYYLEKEKNLHNLLIVYNTGGGFETSERFLARYPGDDVVDVLSFDTYQYGDPKTSDWFEKNTSRDLAVVEAAAGEKNKLFALAETGYEAIPYAGWWTEKLLKAIGDHPISYVLVWRNRGYDPGMKKMHYYVPFKGDVSEADFVKFYELSRTLFEKEAAAAKLYE